MGKYIVWIINNYIFTQYYLLCQLKNNYEQTRIP
jgi:hypothetical protein